MGTTNSTKHILNWYKTGIYDNSGVQEIIVTNTGNKDRVKGLPVYNDTYTLSSIPVGGQTEINVKLQNWNDGIWLKGSEVLTSPGRFGNISIEADKEYVVYGHPDKFVYDYQQGYNNCGVDSSLNILSMAGIKDIVEVGASYNEYLSTPTVKTKTQQVYDPETNSWKTETTETITYPKPNVATEDEFLLWAVQNSNNDKDWYHTMYPDNRPIDGNIPIPESVDIKDYVVHAQNYDEYKTIEDLKDAYKEVGGTTVVHRDNILDYWGVDSSYKQLEIQGVKTLSVEERLIQEAPVYTDNGDGTTTKVTKKTTFDEIGKQETITTVTEKLVNGENEDKENWEVIETKEVVEVIYHTNLEFFSFTQELAKLVQGGKGIIVGGAAYAFEGGKGGGHAISIVGYLESPAELYKTTTITKTSADGTSDSDTSQESTSDILGFYVVDTGGFLTTGLQTERVQFVDSRMLYNFLTDTSYEDGLFLADMNYTNENIREWADKLNVVGNNRKNILYGNDSQNYIWAGKGNDVLMGENGNDYLLGEDDCDTLYGGQGNDVLTGGAGDDTYIFQGRDFMEELATNDINTAKGNHDYLVVGKGKDSIQFDNDTLIDAETEDILEEYIIIEAEDADEAEKFLQEKVQYQNRDGNLVITYSSKNNCYDTDHDGKRDTETPVTTYNNNSITVQDYFKKQLYNSISNVIYANDYHQLEYSFNFVKDILSFGHVDYFSYAEKNNTLKGSKFQDSIIGGNRNDSITGGDANDIINGGASDDTIKAGKGDDKIWGSYGNDKIYGDAGNDIIKYQKEVLPIDNNEFAGSEYGGHDTIYSGSGEDYIELFDYTKNELTFTKAKNDLVITYSAKVDGSKTGGSITIANYFSKKGNTSIKGLRLADGADVISLQAQYNEILESTKNITGTDGYDLVQGTTAADSLVGGKGHDTLNGGNGNDTLNGGQGSDKLYGQAGDNTYVFDSKVSGEDTIYTTGNGKSTLDFTGSGVNFDTKGATDAINEYSFTKVKNDLIINYATETDYSDSDNALIRIASFFTSKNNFEIINADGSTLNLKEQATIYMNGDDENKNKITGSNYNDLIIGYDYNDTFKGGKGNDTIIAGKGNDNLTGGAGINEIQYAKGDGMDTINLTKGESLDIKLTGFNLKTTAPDGTEPTTEIFDYEIVKSNLVISYIDENGRKSDILTIKNFGKKDVTGATGSVKLYNNGTEVMDLRLGNYLDEVVNFTPKKYSYTGKWQSEVIDTRALNLETPSKNKGAKVNAGAGNDTIYGSDYNDTLNGGDGNDIIYGSYGVNKIDGGKGSDTYHLFDTSISVTNSVKETTTIKDTGKLAGDNDTAYIHSSIESITTTAGKYEQQGSIWFNVKVDGTYTTTFNITDVQGNKATITGVENILVGEDATTAKTYNYEAIVSTVANWLSSNGYKDVNAVMKAYDEQDKNEILAIFTDSNNFS